MKANTTKVRTMILIACTLAAIGWIGCGAGKPGGSPCLGHDECSSGLCAGVPSGGNGGAFSQRRGTCAAGQGPASQMLCSTRVIGNYKACVSDCIPVENSGLCADGCTNILPTACQSCILQVSQCASNLGCDGTKAGCCDSQKSGCYKPVVAAAPTPSTQPLCSEVAIQNFNSCVNACPAGNGDCFQGCDQMHFSRNCSSCMVRYVSCVRTTGCDDASLDCCAAEWALCTR